MLVGSRRKAETWVHSFSVDNETRKYKGFTVYRITSIVFPRSAPEALTRVILWKRFSEVKKLYKELVRRHRERHLTGTVPELTEQSYFKRFDPSIIEQRKRYILRLLEFAGQEPILYRSHAFVSFFARGISVDDEDDSPVPIATAIEAEENGKPERVTTGGRSVNGGGGASDTAAKGNIETIRQQLGIRRPVELSLVDPRRDVTIETTPCCSSTSGGEGEEDEDELDGSETPQPAPALTAASEADGCSSSGSLIGSETGSLARETSEEEAAAAAAMDYLVDAAIVFSKAVEAEANGDYKEAFERYKAGIDRLLSGAKDDANVTRRRIAKEKSCKYVSKAEEIYERHLREDEGQGNRAGEQPELSPISPDDPSSPIQLLERPLNYLSRYKVVKVIGTVMQVQDVTDKQFYIMKSIRRPLPSSAGGLPVPSAAVFPQNVPYMVPLVAYFQSTDGCIFLLLRLVCAGKLWDFIRSYRKPPTERYCATPPSEDGELLESGEVVPREEDREADPRGVVDRCDAGFLNLIQEYSNSSNATRGPAGEQRKEEEDGAQQQLEHSTLNKTEEWASERSTVAMDATDDGAFDTDEIGTEAHPDGDEETVELESEERRGSIEADAPVVPSFDVLSQDMDVQELLSCSQQLLKVVAQTLEESSDQAAELESAREEGEQQSKDIESSNSIAGDHQELEEAAVNGRVNSKSHSSQLALATTAGRTTSINDNDGLPSSEEWPNGMQQGCTGDLLPEGVVRRWISELVIAVDALHFNGIVCGDLTMDNLLLGPEGQLMLTYFHRRGESFFNQQAMTTGSSVTVAPKQSAIRGLYVAPERPLEPRSDYWSVGVIMFELLTKRSFVACHPSGVFCYHEVQYPEGVEVSSEARELLEGLLQPDVERRYDFKRIIASPFFRSVDWSEVKQRGHHSWERISRGKRL